MFTKDHGFGFVEMVVAVNSNASRVQGPESTLGQGSMYA